MTTFSISLPTRIAAVVDTETKARGFASRSEFLRDLIRKHVLSKKMFKVYDKKPLSRVRLELARSGKYSERFIESVVKGLSKSSLHAN